MISNDRKPEPQKILLVKPELHNLRLLVGLNMFLLIALFVMPQYFGVHIGWDITCTRLANILITVYALINYRVFNQFTKTVSRCSVTVPLMLYLFTAFYTMIFRVDVNAFMMVFLEILTFYMLVFAVRYVIGIKRAIKTIIGCAYFLSIYGFVEFVAGQSLYLKFLKTVPSNVVNVIRSGYYRIMGPCGHALGYGFLLLLFIAIACIDYEKDEMFLYRRPVLLVMLIANVFLTGSRSSTAIMLLEIMLIIIFSKNDQRKKALMYSLGIIIGLAFLLLLLHKTKIGNYFMLQITILVDSILGTQFSLNFGAELNRLEGSENYRRFLPYVFTLDWLNPILGRGVKRSFAATIYNSVGESANIQSIDNYYVSQFIKYAYPGLITYSIFIITSFVSMIKSAIKYKSDTIKVLIIGFGCYFLNLWWVDALQTLKFVYAFTAIYFAILLYHEDVGGLQSNDD